MLKKTHKKRKTLVWLKCNAIQLMFTTQCPPTSVHCFVVKPQHFFSIQNVYSQLKNRSNLYFRRFNHTCSKLVFSGIFPKTSNLVCKWDDFLKSKWCTCTLRNVHCKNSWEFFFRSKVYWILFLKAKWNFKKICMLAVG